MIAGDPTQRSNTNTLAQKYQAISFNCLGTSGPETPYLPKNKCPGGVRAQVFFPSCGDGRTDSADHQDHMTYSGASGQGKCPKSHPIRYVSLFIERIFSTADAQFNDWSQAKNPSQPFVFAYGDPTGMGYHGDFTTGWDPVFLQKAIDTCTNNSGRIEDCASFTIVNSDCHKSVTVNEVVKGQPLLKLPGCNPVQPGPARAIMNTCPTLPAMFPSPVAYTGDVPPPGTKVVGNQASVIKSYGSYTYKGCYSDLQWTRVLKNQLKVSGQMTVNKCLKACDAQKYNFCALEFASECYGANSLASTSKELPIGKCNDFCKGAPNQICGGGLALSLYTRKNSSQKLKRSPRV